MKNRMSVVFAPLALVGLAAVSTAQTVPFTEDFGTTANWSIAAAPLTAPSFSAAGGPDGSSYITRAYSFAPNLEGDQQIFFRCQTGFGSSGGALFGNYLSSGVTALSFFFRHNAPEPLDVFARFSPAAPGAGVVFVSEDLPANQWVQVIVPISFATPFIYEGAPTLFNSVFGGVGRFQIGAVVTSTLAGSTPSDTLDVDKVSIIPAPSAAMGLAGLLGAAALRRRR
ncbi:MAG: hypothetical protein ACT4PL_02915 [Phycisphaerales bacterium]